LREHQYFIEEAAISYHFSANNFIYDKAKSSDFKKDLLAIAPSFNHHSRNLKKLEHNEDEVEQIATKIKATVWKSTAAKKKHFLQICEQYQIIHIASHGKMNNQESEYSFIAFTENKDSLDDGLLYVSEIYNAPLPAELVVLSACQTASGKLYRGEGLLSIAHAFLFAGTKTIVASLWNVDDAKTPIIMEHFYDNLGQGIEKTKALQQAKLAYLAKADHTEAHPYYWSGFIPIGARDAIQIKPNHFYLGQMFGILAILVVVSFIFYLIYAKRKRV
jgi:CHAT domain-containing protein